MDRCWPVQAGQMEGAAPLLGGFCVAPSIPGRLPAESGRGFGM